MSPRWIEIVTTIVVAFGLSAGSLGAAARGLTGGYRASFIASVAQRCAELNAADAELSKLPPPALRAICQCAAARLADHITLAEIKNGEMSQLRALVEAATNACYGARTRLGSGGAIPERRRLVAVLEGEWFSVTRPLSDEGE